MAGIGFKQHIRLGVVLLLAALACRQTFMTRERLALEVAALADANPCAANLRARPFGDRFAQRVKAVFHMSDPDCLDEGTEKQGIRRSVTRPSLSLAVGHAGNAPLAEAEIHDVDIRTVQHP